MRAAALSFHCICDSATDSPLFTSSGVSPPPSADSFAIDADSALRSVVSAYVFVTKVSLRSLYSTSPTRIFTFEPSFASTVLRVDFTPSISSNIDAVVSRMNTTSMDGWLTSPRATGSLISTVPSLSAASNETLVAFCERHEVDAVSLAPSRPSRGGRGRRGRRRRS